MVRKDVALYVACLVIMILAVATTLLGVSLKTTREDLAWRDAENNQLLIDLGRCTDIRDSLYTYTDSVRNFGSPRTKIQ